LVAVDQFIPQADLEMLEAIPHSEQSLRQVVVMVLLIRVAVTVDPVVVAAVALHMDMVLVYLAKVTTVITTTVVVKVVAVGKNVQAILQAMVSQVAVVLVVM